MKTGVHFLKYLAEFFLEWERFQTDVVEKNQSTDWISHTN